MKVFLYDIETEYEFDDSETNDETGLDSALDEFYNLSEEEGSFFGIIDDFNNCIQFQFSKNGRWFIDIPNPKESISLQSYASYDECVWLIKEIYRIGKIDNEVLRGQN